MWIVQLYSSAGWQRTLYAAMFSLWPPKYRWQTRHLHQILHTYIYWLDGKFTMSTPGFTAESSLYHASERYQFVASLIEGTSGQGITPQQDFSPPTPVPPFYHCSPCLEGQQFCCP